MTSDPFSAFTLRTVGITEHQWIAITSTTLSTDSVDDVSKARAESLRSLHKLLTQQPTSALGRGSTWVAPYHDMKITIHETLVKHDLMTGESINEQELAEYTLPYYTMNQED